MKNDENVCCLGGGILTIGTIFCIINLHIAMIFYQGGNRFAPSPTYFSFTLNFLSELGNVSGWNGTSNLKSEIFFTIAIISTGLSFICYLRHFPTLFPKKSVAHTISLIGKAFGCLSLVGYLFIAFIPSDKERILHLIMVLVAFGALPFTFLCFGIATLLAGIPNRIYSLILFIFSLGMIAYFIYLLLGPSIFSSEGQKFHIIGQKIAVIFEFLMLALIGWFTFRWEYQIKLVQNKNITNKETAALTKEPVLKLEDIASALINHLNYRVALFIRRKKLFIPEQFNFS